MRAEMVIRTAVFRQTKRPLRPRKIERDIYIVFRDGSFFSAIVSIFPEQ